MQINHGSTYNMVLTGVEQKAPQKHTQSYQAGLQN